MTACKCDLCDELFQFKRGTVRVEYHVTIKVDKDGSPTQQGYETDLCPSCSATFLKQIGHRK